jgi:hypothetical protein
MGQSSPTNNNPLGLDGSSSLGAGTEQRDKLKCHILFIAKQLFSGPADNTHMRKIVAGMLRYAADELEAGREWLSFARLAVDLGASIKLDTEERAAAVLASDGIEGGTTRPWPA